MSQGWSSLLALEGQPSSCAYTTVRSLILNLGPHLCAGFKRRGRERRRAGARNRATIKVCGEYLDRDVFAPVFGKFQKGDGDRVGFLAGQTTNHPNAQRLIAGPLFD